MLRGTSTLAGIDDALMADSQYQKPLGRCLVPRALSEGPSSDSATFRPLTLDVTVVRWTWSVVETVPSLLPIDDVETHPRRRTKSYI